ncbi:Translationally-controlled tumor protein like protein [Cladophialophora carrionii]|uniref:Translationally-controlled tumor protein homolog n=1 Tax=Cladophialophora carrionii TaxID=86049 RepID=A0A1C1CMV8_9EURO|nr:Translationally-controlled tumor protein like protein [Cladophialophora carrionii]
MIIYRDIISGDELASDTSKIIDAGNGLWEIDGKMVTKGSENFALEGANPSAEGEDADDGTDETKVTVLDLADQFRLQKIEGGMSKKAYQAELKKYMKALTEKLKEKGTPEEDIKKFQSEAPAAAKKILGNWENYDIYQGESMDENGMYVLVDFREDGMTPYATIWKWGLEEYKV